jgi:rhamnose utilization protein RhaD (predicted bifunctional aldolase and dehydrogenase)
VDKQLNTLIALCRRYGSSRYVSAGGGNVSWKDKDTLWIKASGTYLADADETTLVAVRRKALGDLYRTPVPANTSEREAWAKQIIHQAVENSESCGRPSVETPLHDLFEAAYVVHTHAPLVNGLTCARNAESACHELFPEALWVPYVDPGVTLCLYVKRQFEDYVRDHGREPSLIIMQNHGMVVAADELAEIDLIHGRIFKVLEETYREADLHTDNPVYGIEEVSSLPVPELTGQTGPEPVTLKCTGFQPVPGPLTPDHVVYSGVEPFHAEGGVTLEGYRQRYGSEPRLVVHEGTLYAQGATFAKAKVTCDLASDGALVLRLTEAFGGVNFMTEEQWRFVVNWEAESYRQSIT